MAMQLPPEIVFEVLQYLDDASKAMFVFTCREMYLLWRHTIPHLIAIVKCVFERSYLNILVHMFNHGVPLRRFATLKRYAAEVSDFGLVFKLYDMGVRYDAKDVRAAQVKNTIYVYRYLRWRRDNPFRLRAFPPNSWYFTLRKLRPIEP